MSEYLYERVGCMSCPAMNEAMGLTTRRSRIEFFDEGKSPTGVDKKIALRRGAWVKENVCPGCDIEPKTLSLEQAAELNKIGT